MKQDPWSHLLAGLERKKAGDLAGAERAYRIALEQNPECAEAWMCLALLEEERQERGAAIECYSACVKYGGGNAAVLANLGKLQFEAGRFREAHASLGDAVEREPDNAHYRKMFDRAAFLRDVIEGRSVEAAIAEDGAGEWLDTACGLLAGFGHRDAARRVAEGWARTRPDSSTARYLARALAGDRTLDKSPPDYVVETFDHFAAGFDARLVGALGYDVPAKLCRLVGEAAASASSYENVLDAGCGTGLCGPLLRSMARTLIGVDLSPKMLERAAQRGCYDALVCAELEAYLGRADPKLDAVVAADVMIYFGDLAPVLRAAGGAIRSGGLLAFSTEELSEPGDFRVQTSGRFAHAVDYVRRAAAPWFAEEWLQETTIRLDVAGPVKGDLFLLRRR